MKLMDSDNFNFHELILWQIQRNLRNEEIETNPPDSDRQKILHIRRIRILGFVRNFEDSRVRDNGFTAAWQRGQARHLARQASQRQPEAPITNPTIRWGQSPSHKEGPLPWRPRTLYRVFYSCWYLAVERHVICRREQLFITLFQIYLETFVILISVPTGTETH